jgi:hypothetical protein
MRELLIKFDGTEYRCRASYDVIMHVENKVILSELAGRLATGAASGNVPFSHIVWVMFCLLKAAGAPVLTADDVWEKTKANQLDQDTLQAVMFFIVGEVFGVGPEEELPGHDAEEDGDGKKPEAATPSR